MVIVKKFNAWANRNPLLAVWLGFVAAFLILYFAAPSLVERVEQPAVSHSKGAV
jgi:hypothetical protein